MGGRAGCVGTVSAIEYGVAWASDTTCSKGG